MSRSSKGNSERHGKMVRQKSGPNRAILDQGWREFRRQLDYKVPWNGGMLLAVRRTTPVRRARAAAMYCKTIDRRKRNSCALIVATQITPMWSARSMC